MSEELAFIVNVLFAAAVATMVVGQIKQIGKGPE
jgi:archaellum component FlaG (FlaF/FlaG flagellin family)